MCKPGLTGTPYGDTQASDLVIQVLYRTHDTALWGKPLSAVVWDSSFRYGAVTSSCNAILIAVFAAFSQGYSSPLGSIATAASIGCRCSPGWFWGSLRMK